MNLATKQKRKIYIKIQDTFIGSPRSQGYTEISHYP